MLGGEPCACRGAKPDGPLGKNDHCIPNLDAPSLGAAEARRHYVRAHQDLLVREAHRHSAQIGHGVRHTHKFGLAAVDGVAEFPTADRLPTVLGPCTVLRAVAAKTRVAVAARSDGPGDYPLALVVATHRGTELFDHTDRFVAHSQALGDRIFALEDMDVRATDRRRGDSDQRIERADIRD